ncbi:MAG: hypothetical protein AAFW68_08505 [Pseudomonadota bacterium]
MEVFEFAFLTWNREEERLEVLVELPNAKIVEEAPVLLTPWHLFDFDLASLTVMTPYLMSPQRGFSFGMALLWADETESDPATWMGDVTARYDGTEQRLGHDTLRYELTGSALEGSRSTGPYGALWLDDDDGHIVEAAFPMPNHPGYTDFLLRLERVSDGGSAEWDELLNAHYQDCE